MPELHEDKEYYLRHHKRAPRHRYYSSDSDSDSSSSETSSDSEADLDEYYRHKARYSHRRGRPHHFERRHEAEYHLAGDDDHDEETLESRHYDYEAARKEAHL